MTFTFTIPDWTPTALAVVLVYAAGLITPFVYITLDEWWWRRRMRQARKNARSVADPWKGHPLD